MQLPSGIDPHTGVSIREAWGVDHQKRIGPRFLFWFLSSAKNGNVIRFAFTRTAVPRNQQFTIGELDNSRRVIVLWVQRKDQFRGKEWLIRDRRRNHPWRTEENRDHVERLESPMVDGRASTTFVGVVI